MLNLNDESFCYGCGVCAISCKSNAIEILKSPEGFFVPKLDESKCVDCSICDKICPFYNEKFSVPIDFVASFSAYSRDENIRNSSTSGGFAHELSLLLLDDGYKVVGVEYDYEFHIAKHSIADNLTELAKFQGSKYLQSYTVDAFNAVFNRENKDEQFLIIGSPCQIAAMKELAKLKKKNFNHIYIDFFCHGVPSYFLWQKYLKYNVKKHSLDAISKVVFRDKRSGWHNFTFVLGDKKHEVVSEFKRNDLFHSFFLNNLCLNRACYTNCKFKGTSSCADIRIGDLWGTKFQSDEKGVSGGVIYSEKGMSLIERLKDEMFIEMESIDVVTESQLKSPLMMPIQRDNVIRNMQGEKSLAKLYFEFILPLKYKKYWGRALRKIKRTVRL